MLNIVTATNQNQLIYFTVMNNFQKYDQDICFHLYIYSQLDIQPHSCLGLISNNKSRKTENFPNERSLIARDVQYLLNRSNYDRYCVHGILHLHYRDSQMNDQLSKPGTPRTNKYFVSLCGNV